MLPLAFAALVWPARRTWAIRAVELLVALILSKFAIVAVLALGGAAMDQLGHSVTAPIVGLVLVVMGAFAPWAVLRLVPLAEVASAAVGSLRGEALQRPATATAFAYRVSSTAEWAAATTQSMSRNAERGLLPPGSGTADDDDYDGDGSPLDGADPGPDPGPGGPGSDGDGPGGDAGPRADSPSPVDLEASPIAGGVDPGGGPATVGPGDGRGASPEPPQERLPGLPPMWQAENFSWKPLVLGPHEDGAPTLWPPDPPGGWAQGPAGPPADDSRLPGAEPPRLDDPPALSDRPAGPSSLQPPTVDPEPRD